jgi:NCS1 family nucleobase:cation symporter-1
LSDVKITANAFSNIINLDNFLNINNLAPLLTVAGAIFAYFSILIISFGDFSRYVKNDKELKKGNLSLILNLIIFSFFSVFIVTGSDIFLNQKFSDMDRIFTNPTDIIGKFDNLQITIIALFFIVIASASTNLVANYIPSQYSLINLVPTKLTLRSSSYIISFFGLLISIFWLTILSQIGILSFIDTFAAFFGPLFGLIASDYYLIRKENLSNKDLYLITTDSSYYYSGGWQIKGVYSLMIGFIFSASTIWNTNLMFLQSYAWIIGALVTLITYYLLAKK